VNVKVIRTVSQMRAEADRLRTEGRRVALVPTMGYLHEGHASLIRRALRAADRVVVSVFVNPTQFGPSEDFATYPRDFDGDRDLIEKAGGHILYAPEVEEVYPLGHGTSVIVEGPALPLEGQRRPGHFRGVATVVAKLFAATKPHVAVFGQKDAQQVAVIRRMAADLDLGVEVVVAPTVREADGLARSSRNIYLREGERRQATVLYQALQEGRRAVQHGETNPRRVADLVRQRIELRPLARVDYAEVVDPATFAAPEVISGKVALVVAVWFGKARLIDNMLAEARPNPLDAPGYPRPEAPV
jgi:pantoate--beta-alanine ligase